MGALAPVYVYGATVESIHDGDTFHAAVRLGFFVDIHPAIRILGINAPELTAKGGPEATGHLASLMPLGASIIVQSVKPDKYGGRVDAKVFRAADGLDIGAQMIADGFAVPLLV